MKHVTGQGPLYIKSQSYFSPTADDDEVDRKESISINDSMLNVNDIDDEDDKFVERSYEIFGLNDKKEQTSSKHTSSSSGKPSSSTASKSYLTILADKSSIPYSFFFTYCKFQ